ncbi:hypothetical protein M433DRAFT_501332 [Acidomyces richmondensis BFW]|nr:MAG: hypothetical protein FE78DRAFT_304199 [Acidomyces sp. 'richmondensis']KYG47393.1 hypothetical protein M433DRAFT_501332 [Acidomyces richmondensis BFW]
MRCRQPQHVEQPKFLMWTLNTHIHADTAMPGYCGGRVSAKKKRMDPTRLLHRRGMMRTSHPHGEALSFPLVLAPSRSCRRFEHACLLRFCLLGLCPPLLSHQSDICLKSTLRRRSRSPDVRSLLLQVTPADRGRLLYARKATSELRARQPQLAGRARSLTCAWYRSVHSSGLAPRVLMGAEEA